VQASSAPTQVSPKQLAAELLEFWHHQMRGSAASVYQLVEDLDLSLTQMKALHALSDCVREVSVKELSDRLGMSLPGTSRTVDAMLRRGWLERREDEHDRRMKRVGITDAGREVVERIDTARLAGLQQYTAALSPEQRAALSAALSDLPHRS
jgi:DNA-binding MarR family transcriptional regulator